MANLAFEFICDVVPDARTLEDNMIDMRIIRI